MKNILVAFAILFHFLSCSFFSALISTALFYSILNKSFYFLLIADGQRKFETDSSAKSEAQDDTAVEDEEDMFEKVRRN